MGERHQTFVVVNRPKEIGNVYLKDFNKKFGIREKIVLPFHHQWLFGLTAIHNCINVMKTSKKIGWGYIGRYINEFHNNVIPLFTSIQNLTERDEKIKFEWFSYEGDNFPEMRDFFDIGDNNQGITIMYPQEGKYCFMFINPEYEDEEESDLNRKIPYVPMTANEYLGCFYDKDETKKSKYQKVLKSYKGFELMTLEEVKEIFPKWSR